jgi:prolyl oligopeptidase
MRIRLLLLTAVSAMVIAPLAIAADASAPPAAVKPAGDSFHGVTVSDPYRWLEDAGDPPVKDWSDAQNRRTRAYLDGLAARAPIKAELTQLTSTTSPSFYELKRGGDTIFAMFSQPPKQQPMLAAMPLSADPDAARVVIDPNTMNAKGTTAIDWFVPSPDGRLVAVSMSEGGSEDGTLHIFDVASGKGVDEPIPGVQYPTAGGSMAWAADGKSFWYTRYPTSGPDEERHFFQHVYFHTIGKSAAGDPDMLGKDIPNPKISEIQLDDGFDPGHPTAIIENGDSGHYVVYALKGNRFVQVAGYDDQIIAATRGPDHALYLVSRSGAPHSKILKLSPGEFDLHKAKVIVPEDDGTIASISEDDTLPFAIAGDRLYVKKLVGGPSRVDIYDLNGKKEGALPLPDIAAVDEVVPAGDEGVLFSVATYLRPPYFARYDAAAGQAEETKLVQTSPIGFDDVEAVRVFTASKDGTKVPINIIRRKGTRLDGNNPVLLYGYGGYGISMTPRFLGGTAGVAGWRRGLCRRQYPRRRRVWRGLAPERCTDPQAERLRRLLRRRAVHDQGGLYDAEAPGDHGRQQWRTADGSGVNPTSRRLPHRRRTGRHL